jgi:hypothetical protein
MSILAVTGAACVAFAIAAVVFLLGEPMVSS